MKLSDKRFGSLLSLLGILIFAGECRMSGLVLRDDSKGIRVEGPGTMPHLEFACCEHGIEEMQSLFAQPGVIPALKELHATVVIPTLDFSPQRTDVVRLLNREGVPVVGWMLLSKEQGYYLNADNVRQGADRIADFERWTKDNDLRWAAVGLDIEPDLAEFAQFKEHRWRLIGMLIGRSVRSGRIRRAQQAYSNLVIRLRSHGYAVQVYQMPYVPAERSVHSSLPDRLLGTVDINGDQEYVMLYTSYARPIGAGMIWSLGPHARGIGIGSTDGDTAAGTGSGPLDWDEFSRDLIVASHFTNHVGVYDLEGCVRQGFLMRLVRMDWSQSTIIPAESAKRAARLGFLVRSVLWIGSNLLYFILIGLLLISWLVWRRFARRVG